MRQHFGRRQRRHQAQVSAHKDPLNRRQLTLVFSAPGMPDGAVFTVTKRDLREELAEADERPLLYSRDQTGRLLNVSVATVRRLEAQGLLTPIRLNKRSPTGKVFHRRSEVFALAQTEERRRQATFE